MDGRTMLALEVIQLRGYAHRDGQLVMTKNEVHQNIKGGRNYLLLKKGY